MPTGSSISALRVATAAGASSRTARPKKSVPRADRTPRPCSRTFSHSAARRANMKTVLRWLVRIGAVLLVVLVIAATAVYALTQIRLTRTYSLAAETVAMPSDRAGVARGQHVAIISGCVDCHGADLGGRVFFDNPMVGRFVASNLTPGSGGVGSRFGDADWIRAIRHGVRPDGTPLLVMPAREYFALSDDDLGALIAYIKTLAPVERELPRSQ